MLGLVDLLGVVAHRGPVSLDEFEAALEADAGHAFWGWP